MKLVKPKKFLGQHFLKDLQVAQDIANTVAWLLQQPKHVNVNRIEIMPVSQTFGPQPVYRD